MGITRHPTAALVDLESLVPSGMELRGAAVELNAFIEMVHSMYTCPTCFNGWQMQQVAHIRENLLEGSYLPH